MSNSADQSLSPFMCLFVRFIDDLHYFQQYLSYIKAIEQYIFYDHWMTIRRGRVVSVGDLKTGVPGSILSNDTTDMVESPWARHIFL